MISLLHSFGLQLLRLCPFPSVPASSASPALPGARLLHWGPSWLLTMYWMLPPNSCEPESVSVYTYSVKCLLRGHATLEPCLNVVLSHSCCHSPFKALSHLLLVPSNTPRDSPATFLTAMKFPWGRKLCPLYSLHILDFDCRFSHTSCINRRCD